MLINMELLVNMEISLFFRQHNQKYKNYNVYWDAFTRIFSLGNQGIKLELIAMSWKCNNIRSAMNKDFPIESNRSKSVVKGLRILVHEPVIFHNKNSCRCEIQSIVATSSFGPSVYFPHQSDRHIPQSIQPEYRFHLLNNTV